MSVSRPVLQHLRRSLFAQDCVLCGASSGDALLCSGCTADLPRLETACPQCASPQPRTAVCGACLRSPPAFDATLALWRYAFPLDSLIQSLKYGSRLALADLFGQHLAQRLAAPDVDLIVPLPLHEHRLRRRGFNQAMEIARRAVARLNIPLRHDLLLRLRDTPPQTELAHNARLVNMRSAFGCLTRIDGLRVAVVDDVMTTGATLAAAAIALKRAGAARVENWVVARAIPHSSGAVTLAGGTLPRQSTASRG